MKNRITAVGLALAVLFSASGCASMLERSYSASAPHVDRPVTAEDSSVLRVENYRELVSAVLYLVAQGEETGTIQLHGYTGEVEADLTAACLEVATEDPLGAYAVDYIKHEFAQVVSYYQVTLAIHYRRTPEQIRSLVNVTGAGAIRSELQEALSLFSPEVVLRVAYFAEDDASIARLLRQAYYDTPVTALGMPEAEIALYPDAGQARVVEVLLTYPREVEQLRRASEQLADEAGGISSALRGLEARPAAVRAASELRRYARFDPEAGATAYDAIVDGTANDEGMALAYALLCQQGGLSCEVVEGERLGQSSFWNALQFSAGERLYLDPAQGDGLLHTAEEFYQAGYRWADGAQEAEPALGEAELP